MFTKVICCMALFFTTSSVSADIKNPKVVVVGAGLAGMTTAYRLQQKGVDVELYEARNRVGGRVFTVKINGNIAEMGGKNITDGANAENMLGLSAELGLELYGYKVTLDHSYFTGDKLIPFHQLLSGRNFHPENLKAQIHDLALRSKNMREVLIGILDAEEPLYKSLAVRLAAYEGAPIDQLSPLYAETLYHMLLGGVAAAHQTHTNEEKAIELLSIKGGNALLPEKIAESLADRLHLNRPLTKVSKQEDGSFVLTFQEDQKVKADILVLAIPCSVYEEIVFEEDILPRDRLDAIKNVRYGTNAKIMVPFSETYPKRVGFAGERIVTFFETDHNLLTLYYTGGSGLFSEDTVCDAYRRERPMIEMGFAEMCPPLAIPTYAKDESFASYEGPVGYSWPNDPYAKGSYSFIAAGQETVLTALNEAQGEVVKTLFAPVDQKLYFAGEHASILMEVPGTMEAACESGERTARMILNTIKLQENLTQSREDAKIPI